MPYVAPSTVSSGQTYTAAAHNVIVEDVIDHEARIVGLTPPTGSLIEYAAGVSIPAGYLACNGQAVSRTTYANLFALIGTTYGIGDNTTTFNVPRVIPNVTLDAPFDPVQPFSEYPAGNVVRTIVSPSFDNKIYVGGYIVTTKFGAANLLARYNEDGTLDTTYTNTLNGDPYAQAFDSSNRQYVVGAFNTANGTTRNRVARFTGNTLDAYNPNINATCNAIALQSDGKALVGGAFTTVGGTARNYLARLNTDGTLDTGFTPTINGVVRAIFIQSDGKILIGGDFTTVNGSSRTYVARLNADGTLDTGFNASPNNAVYTISRQSDGKIIIGGSFTYVQSDPLYTGLARLDATTGQVDTTFSCRFTDGQVSSIVVLSDNSIIAVGTFSVVNGRQQRGLCKISSGGVSDSNWRVNIPETSTMHCVSLDSKNRILVSGNYSYIGIPAYSLTNRVSWGWNRLFSASPITQTLIKT